MENYFSIIYDEKQLINKPASIRYDKEISNRLDGKKPSIELSNMNIGIRELNHYNVILEESKVSNHEGVEIDILNFSNRIIDNYKSMITNNMDLLNQIHIVNKEAYSIGSRVNPNKQSMTLDETSINTRNKNYKVQQSEDTIMMNKESRSLDGSSMAVRIIDNYKSMITDNIDLLNQIHIIDRDVKQNVIRDDRKSAAMSLDETSINTRNKNYRVQQSEDTIFSNREGIEVDIDEISNRITSNYKGVLTVDEIDILNKLHLIDRDTKFVVDRDDPKKKSIFMDNTTMMAQLSLKELDQSLHLIRYNNYPGISTDISQVMVRPSVRTPAKVIGYVVKKTKKAIIMYSDNNRNIDKLPSFNTSTRNKVVAIWY